MTVMGISRRVHLSEFKESLVKNVRGTNEKCQTCVRTYLNEQTHILHTLNVVLSLNLCPWNLRRKVEVLLKYKYKVVAKFFVKAASIVPLTHAHRLQHRARSRVQDIGIHARQVIVQ